jgi:hypothetical protein
VGNFDCLGFHFSYSWTNHAGPGLLFIFLGLSLLALEIEWARELNKQGMQGLEQIVAKVKSFFSRRKS